jgi:hypothetical protein
MKAYVTLRHLAEFFLEWEMFQTKFVEKAKTRILYSITCSRKSSRLRYNVEKQDGARQATDDNTIRQGKVQFACRITTTKIQTYTHNIQYPMLLRCNSGDANPPQCYVIHTHCLSFICFSDRAS